MAISGEPTSIWFLATALWSPGRSITSRLGPLSAKVSALGSVPFARRWSIAPCAVFSTSTASSLLAGAPAGAAAAASAIGSAASIGAAPLPASALPASDIGATAQGSSAAGAAALSPASASVASALAVSPSIRITRPSSPGVTV